MSGGERNGDGPQPPPDDRTLLDPLSNDELRALREARKRMQAKKAAGKSSAIKHQIVITPEPEDEAAPREKPVLPSFDGDVTLDQIRVPPPSASDAPPSSPAEAPTVAPAGSKAGRPVGSPDAPSAAAPGGPSGPSAGGSESTSGSTEPRAGSTGFGENTLLWMQPVKEPQAAPATVPSAQDPMFRPSPRENSKRWIRALGLAIALAAIVGGVAFMLSGSERGQVDLRTQPLGAELFVDGESYGKTPAKLSLPPGSYQLRMEKAGFQPREVRIRVDGDLDEVREVDLVPASRPGLMTTTIRVQPIAARVTVDEEVYPAAQTVHVPNLDPNAAHRIRVEADGFIKTERVVAAGKLEPSYQITLERDDVE